jgi:integrase
VSVGIRAESWYIRWYGVATNEIDTNIMALTDLQVRKAMPGAKICKLSDGGGLQLWITPDGAKRWRVAYRFGGGQKLLAIGVYPAISLREARDARDAAKRLLADGQDPSFAKRLAKAAKVVAAANSFEAVAAELFEKKKREGKTPRTLEKMEWLLGIAAPLLGARPIAEISAAEILAVLRGVEGRGKHEAARKLRAIVGEVFRYAIATQRANSDPSRDLKGALTAPVVTPRAAITKPDAFGALLRAIDGYEGAPETRFALQLVALTFVRPGEVRAAEWAEIDLEAGVWTIPAQKMKMKREHRVPLVPQSITLLCDLKAITGRGKFLFPSIRTPLRCMSENTINAALRRLGFAKEEMCSHGFRSAASSMLNESGLWNADAIERQLAHVDNDSVRRAYARADFWEERVRMMAWWAYRCDELRRGGNLVAVRA